jgi:polyribonucleotide nucleotidyltransferase
MLHKVEIDLFGTQLSIESGVMAKQADGAVIVRSGDNVVLVTACCSGKARAGANFFPLTVDYREATYAAGKFPGGFIKREGRMTEKETLTCRLIDRPIRPLFPEGFLHETQVIGLVLSAETERDPAPLAMVGAGAALGISNIPFHEVLAAVRVGKVDGKFIANPTYNQTKDSSLSLIVAATETGVVMVEAGAKHVDEEEVLAALEFGHECCKKICAGIRELMKLCGKTKYEFVSPKINEEMFAKIDAMIRTELTDALDTKKYNKLESYSRIDALHAKVEESFPEEERSEAGKLFDRLKETIFRDEMLKARRRPVRTVRRCSPAAKRRRWLPVRSARRMTNSGLKCSIRLNSPSATCCITTSRHSRWAKWASCAARAVGKSATAHWANAPRSPLFLTKRASPTQSV